MSSSAGIRPRHLQEADIVDASLIEEIVRSGFVEELYQTKVGAS